MKKYSGFRYAVMVYLVVVTVLFVLGGCASSGLSPDELERKELDRAEQWEICKKLYHDAHMPTVSNHHHGRGQKHDDWDVRDDLMLNSCRRILTEAGLWEYNND